MTKYVPKQLHFRDNEMVAQTQLAILDHNANVNRSQAEVKKRANIGKKGFKIVCLKQRKNWVAKQVKTPKSHAYFSVMMEDILACREGKKLKKYKPVTQAKCIAPTPKPLKPEIIDRHKSQLSGL